MISIANLTQLAAARAANPTAVICLQPATDPWLCYFPGRDDQPVELPNGGVPAPVVVRP